MSKIIVGLIWNFRSVTLAGNGGIDVSWDIWSYVRLADGAENEDKAFCFTFHDPANGQPEEPKMSSEIGAMLAIVRHNCA